MKQLKTLLAVLLFLAGVTSSVMAQTATPAQYMQAGNTAYGAKNYDQAIQYYQAVIGLSPNYGPAYQGLGNSYYFKGDNTSALKNYEKALSLDPNNASLSSFVQSLRAKVGTTVPAPAAASPVASSSMASAGPSSSANKFQLEINAGLGLDSSVLGFGGGLTGYFPLDKNFYLGAGAAFFTFSQGQSGTVAGYGVTETASASANESFIEGAARVKYVFDGKDMQPYLFVGGGIADYSSSASGSASSGGTTVTGSAAGGSQIDPLLILGGGVQFPAGKDMSFSAQLRESLIFVPGTTVSETVGGVTESVSGGGGTGSYTVLEAGLNFDI